MRHMWLQVRPGHGAAVRNSVRKRLRLADPAEPRVDRAEVELHDLVILALVLVARVDLNLDSK